MRSLALSSLLLVALNAFSACDNPDVNEGPGSTESPIVNGNLETGYPHVGALTLWYGNSYYGAFCTGTLIAPNWVLTAAHCFDDGTEANNVRFFIGNNANSPNSGSFYRAERLIPHDRYNPNTLVNDIGLIKLSDPVPSNVAQPIPYATTSLANMVGRSPFYVGFGRITGRDVANDGSGVKRSTTFPITRVEPQFLVSNYNGTSTCQGDSGGPALLDINNVSTILSVTSHGIDCTVYDPSCDVCQTTSYATRLDVQAPWVKGHLDGTDGTSPGSNLNCEAIYDCMVDCGSSQSCQTNCYESGSSTGKSQINTLLTCLDNNCSQASSDAAFQSCAENYCASPINTCFGGGGGSTPNPTYTTCESVYDCMANCSTQSCSSQCYENADATSQSQVNGLLSCMDSRCGHISNDDAFLECVYSSCSTQIDTCFPDSGGGESCDLRGGDCSSNTACLPSSATVNECYPTAGVSLRGVCDFESNSAQCVDGAICVGDNVSSDGICLPFCTRDSHCLSNEYCDFEITEGLTGTHGICLESEEDTGGGDDGGGDNGGGDNGGGDTGGGDNGGGDNGGGDNGGGDNGGGDNGGGDNGGGNNGAGNAGGCSGASSTGPLGSLLAGMALLARRRRR